MHLSFVTFELEEEQDCGYDFIEVSSSTVWVANGHACLKEVTAVAVQMRQSPQTNFVRFKIAVDGHRSH